MIDQIIDGRTDRVFEYISQGGRATDRDGHGTRLIQWCAYYGDVSAIRYLILQGESLRALGDNLDLNGACFHGHWRLCQFLIENGADVNRPLPETGETPLHAALCKAGRPAYNLVVKLLLSQGADPRCTTFPNAPTGGFMRDCRTKRETPLHRAAAYGDEEVIDLLLAAGAAREAKDMSGDSPLTWASWHQRPGNIMRKLCYGDHTVSPSAVFRYRSDHGCGWGNGMEVNLLGLPHIPDNAAPNADSGTP